MTSVHLPRPLTLEDWDALPEDNSAHFELQEGVLIVTPRPLRPHARAVFRIAKQLDDQGPDDLETIIEFEICVDAAYPATVRIPDVVITCKVGSERRLDGSDVLVAIEVVSPGSKRTDTVTKRSEYAEARDRALLDRRARPAHNARGTPPRKRVRLPGITGGHRHVHDQCSGSSASGPRRRR